MQIHKRSLMEHCFLLNIVFFFLRNFFTFEIYTDKREYAGGLLIVKPQDPLSIMNTGKHEFGPEWENGNNEQYISHFNICLGEHEEWKNVPGDKIV